MSTIATVIGAVAAAVVGDWLVAPDTRRAFRARLRLRRRRHRPHRGPQHAAQLAHLHALADQYRRDEVAAIRDNYSGLESRAKNGLASTLRKIEELER